MERESIVDIVFTDHALFQMKRRGITEVDLISLIKGKEHKKIKTKDGKIIFQGRYFDRVIQKEMLLRVIGKETEKGFVIITAYKTSKIEKYLRKEVFKNESDL